MMIHDITVQVGPHKSRRRVGRGEGSGRGGTSGRGHKGAASRSGFKRRAGYEGGSKPFAMRMPKVGFTNAPFRTDYNVVNLKAIDSRCNAGERVDIESLARLGLVRDPRMPLKVLGEGELTKKLHIVASKFSASAKAKIEKAGGTIEEIVRTTWTRAAAGQGAKKDKKEKKAAGA
jgi:large subunit ribosomal protein L15